MNTKKQAGFVEKNILLLGAGILVLIGVFYAVSAWQEKIRLLSESNSISGQQQLANQNQTQDGLPNTKQAPAPASTPLSTPLPANPPAILTVVDLTGDPSKYLGQRVRVSGKIRVNVFYGSRPCPDDGLPCDTTMGARLELWSIKTVAEEINVLLPFLNGKEYPCPKIGVEQYACPPYVEGQIVTLEGVWSKDQIPDATMGYSNSNQPPKVLSWKDRYFLNIIN